MSYTRLCSTAEVPENEALIVPYKSRSLGVFRVNGEFHALLNVCPHKGAALCRGPITGTSECSGDTGITYVRSGELVRCAWHGWEFDIRTGDCLADPKIKAKKIEIQVRDGEIFARGS
ncbi:Rieske (2Fe-2S) protein [Ruegeria sp. SCP11]|uniref:Rieske (2Fe-2S) protein n=1 Tax=Ruegeria sp. SCP11 TaxID=3141378 RepID=UPI003335C6EE